MQDLPVTRLSVSQLLPPYAALLGAALFVGAIVAMLGLRTDISQALMGAVGLKLLLGFAVFVPSTIWLARSWLPGGGHATDYALPWLLTAFVVLAGLLQPRLESGITAFVAITFLSIPLMLGFTWLTRRYAPTDICSTSSAIGFASGGGAIMLYGLHCPLNDAPTILLAYALGLGAAVLFSRAALCHFIKW